MGMGFGMPSIWTATSLSLGPRKRKVTLLSACTSGEITGAGVCAGVVEAVKVPSRMASPKIVRFMIPLCPKDIAPAPGDDTTDRALRGEECGAIAARRRLTREQPEPLDPETCLTRRNIHQIVRKWCMLITWEERTSRLTKPWCARRASLRG